MKIRPLNLKIQNYIFLLIKFFLSLTTLLGLPFLSLGLAFAATVTLTDGNPATITDFTQEYQVKVDLSINVPDGTIYYLRGVFYKPGTTNYCGYTWNGSTWYRGPISTNEGWKNFLPVIISSSSASIVLKAKLDLDDNGCNNSGDYNFKVQRFTQNSSSGIFDSQNEQLIIVDIPTPSPTPSKIPTLAPSPTPTLIPLVTLKPTATSSFSFEPTRKPTATITPKEISEVINDNYSSEKTVLGENLSLPTITPFQGQKIEDKTSGMSRLIVFLLLGGGTICIALALFLSVKQIRSEKFKVG